MRLLHEKVADDRIQTESSEKGFAKFGKIWLDDFGDHFAKIDTIDESDTLTGEMGPRHGFRRIQLQKL